MLTVKKSNHKIRSRDLLLSLMCYGRHAFTDVVGRVDRRLDSSTILGLPTFFFFSFFFFFLSFFFFFFLFDGCIESDSKSLSRWRKDAYRKIYGPGLFKVAEENNLFSSFHKIKHYQVSWAQRPSSKVRLGII